MPKLINRSYAVHDNIPHLPAAVGKGVSLFIQIGHKLDYILIRLQKFQSHISTPLNGFSVQHLCLHLFGEAHHVAGAQQVFLVPL